jgi:hypothetical protein
MTAKKFNFPVWLKGSKEQRQAEAERQALALAIHGRGHLSEAERLIGRGALLEQTARQNLEASGKNNQARILLESQLADALAMQGKYVDAASIHPDPERKEYFESIVTALEMDDEEKCDCPDTDAKIGDVDIAVTPRFERAKIFSPIHRELVSLVECSKCGHLNARPLRSQLLKHNDAIAQNEAAMSNKNARLISDVQVLNAGT